MKKLTLDLESLHVDSFTTESKNDKRGTIRAHSEGDPWHSTYGTACWPYCGSQVATENLACSVTCPGAGGECNKPSMYLNDCEI